MLNLSKLTRAHVEVLFATAARSAVTRRSRRWLVPLLASATIGLAGCYFGAGNGVIQVANDPFLGPTKGFVLGLDPFGNTAVSVKEAQGKFTMEVMVVQHGLSATTARAGDKAEFVVGSEVLTLEIAADAAPVVTPNQYGAITQWKLTFHLDDQATARFAKAPLTAIKVNVGGESYQLALQPQQASKFQSNLATMTSSPAPGPVVAVTSATTPAK